MAALGLCWCPWTVFSCREWGLLPVVVCRYLIVVTSSDMGTDCRHVGSVVAAHRSSYSKPCEIFPDQGSNWCPRRRQAKSHPLCHQGKAICFIFKSSFQFTAKLKGRYRIFPYTSCSHTCIASLIINIPTSVIYLLKLQKTDIF